LIVPTLLVVGLKPENQAGNWIANPRRSRRNTKGPLDSGFRRNDGQKL